MYSLTYPAFVAVCDALAGAAKVLAVPSLALLLALLAILF